MLFVLFAILTTANAFGAGRECVGLEDRKGNCVAVSACTTNEWLYGTKTDPVCDTPGPYSENSIVCCLDLPDVKSKIKHKHKTL